MQERSQCPYKQHFLALFTFFCDFAACKGGEEYQRPNCNENVYPAFVFQEAEPLEYSLAEVLQCVSVVWVLNKEKKKAQYIPVW